METAKKCIIPLSYVLFLKVRWHFLSSRGQGRSTSSQFFWGCRLLFLIFFSLGRDFLQRRLFGRAAQRRSLMLTISRGDHVTDANRESRRREINLLKLSQFFTGTELELDFLSCFFTAHFFLPGMLIWTFLAWQSWPFRINCKKTENEQWVDLLQFAAFD